ncbi:MULTISPECIES: hypothetical protein [unclassified Streptomyces]|uniref:hypothetical protein n=1 Tax=unclassified Streptomyces TaxID=2593676 RepID=UPI00201ECF86|nr:hypothetical protein [Streptomyces sp. 35G-GA-8]MCL7378193.1 hypothetical protein [Streptomyces sp. 35G-GA-8]
MLSQTVRPREITLDHHALTMAMAEPEAPFSDAPVYAPEAAGALLLLLLLSPKEPKEPKGL